MDNELRFPHASQFFRDLEEEGRRLWPSNSERQDEPIRHAKRKRDEEIQEFASKKLNSREDDPVFANNKPEEKERNLNRKKVVNLMTIRSIDELSENQMTDVIKRLLKGSDKLHFNPEIQNTSLMTRAIQLVDGKAIKPSLLTLLLSKSNRQERNLWSFQKKLFEYAGNELMSSQACNKMISRAASHGDLKLVKKAFDRAYTQRMTNSIVYTTYIHALNQIKIEALRNRRGNVDRVEYIKEIKQAFQWAIRENFVDKVLFAVIINILTNESGENSNQILLDILPQAHQLNLIDDIVCEKVMIFALQEHQFILAHTILDYAIAIKSVHGLHEDKFIDRFQSLQASEKSKRNLCLMYVEAMIQEGYEARAEKLFCDLNLVPRVENGLVDLKSYSPGTYKLALKYFVKSPDCPNQVELALSREQLAELVRGL